MTAGMTPSAASAVNYFLGLGIGFLFGWSFSIVLIAFTESRKRRQAMASATTANGGNGDQKAWWAKYADWVIQQGPSTVMLAVVLYFIGHVVVNVAPQQLKEIQAGYRQITDEHSKTVDKILAAHEKDREAWERDTRESELRARQAANK